MPYGGGKWAGGLSRLFVVSRFPLLLWAVVGAVLAGTFPPSPLGFLAPLPLALLFRAVANATPRRAWWVTLAFAGGFFALHLLWLPASLAQMLGPGVAVLYLLLVGLLAAFWALTAVLTCRLLGGVTLWGLPFAWVLLDALRALGPFGFTWGSLGYAFAQTPFVQVADLGGVALVGLLVTLPAAALASGQARALAASLTLLLLAGGYGLTRPEEAPGQRRALLVQGNIDPRSKVAGRAADDLKVYLDLSRTGLAVQKADLVVWPETAAPAAPTELPVAHALTALRVPLLLGAPTQAGGYWNSVYAFEGGGVAGRQDKVRLVPFGEFFPARTALDRAYRTVFRALGLPALTGTVPGTALTPLPIGNVMAGVLICYESTFPAFARALVRRGADVLVTVSNDAWFGTSLGAEQHFQMGRVRAIETRRWWLRVGNDGVSAVVDPAGRVTARFPRGVRAAFPANFATSTVLTPYVRFGEWPALLSPLILLYLAWRNRKTAARTPGLPLTTQFHSTGRIS